METSATSLDEGSTAFGRHTVAFRRSGSGMTSVTAPVRVNIVSRFSRTMMTANQHEENRVARLRVGPDRIDELEVERRRQENAAARRIEERRDDHGERDVADEEWR